MNLPLLSGASQPHWGRKLLLVARQRFEEHLIRYVAAWWQRTTDPNYLESVHSRRHFWNISVVAITMIGVIGDAMSPAPNIYLADFLNISASIISKQELYFSKWTKDYSDKQILVSSLCIIHSEHCVSSSFNSI